VPTTPPPPRVRRLRALLDARDCAHAIVEGTDNVLHLTGYIRYLGAPAAVVIGPGGERTLIVARFELAAAEAEAEAETVVPYGGEDFLDFAPMLALSATAGTLVGMGGGRVALAGSGAFRAAFRTGCEPAVEVDSDLQALRRIKDPDEVDRIRCAFRLALIGQGIVEALAAEGRSEIELYTAAFAAAQEAAGTPVEMVGALASGSRTSLVAAPAHVPGALRVPPGAPVLADIAIRHRGYWGDSTRTLAGADDVVAATRAILETILDETARGLRPGRRVGEVDAEMRSAIASRLPGATFPHHGGHCIGIEVGEDPQIVPGEKTVVEEGMVFAIEPGAYWPGARGVRVENSYVVHSWGAEIVA